MLVYLATADLARLEAAQDHERAAFFTICRERECELALSLHHLQEIAQLGSRTSVWRRLDTLSLFPTLRCKPATEDVVLRFEIQVEVYRALGFKVDLDRSALDTFFPHVDLDWLREEVENSLPVFAEMRAAYELGASATNAGKEAVSVGPQLNLRRQIDPADLGVEHLDQLLGDVAAGLPPALRQVTEHMFNEVRTAVVDHGTPRRALEVLYGLSDLALTDNLRDDDLALASVYYRVAREEVPRILEKLPVDLGLAEPLIEGLNPYRAPGFSLRLAVQRARRRHPRPDGPGEDIDAAHLSFAPYVDLLFADRHTYGFITQEARDRPKCMDLSAAHRVRRGGSLTRLIGALESHGESA